MQTRKLGRSSLHVAPLALGTNVFGWTIDEKTSHAILDAFVDGGFNLIDTADVYSRWVPGNAGGESETIIGSWLKATGKRDRIVLATKGGSDMGLGDGKTLKKSYILKAADESLRRLQTDVIDLYQTHYDDLATAPDETLSAYDELVRAGKVRYIGASNMSAERLKANLDLAAAQSLPRYETMQPEYNLYARQEFETSLQPLCVAEEVSVLPYYGLASGFLTGKYRSEADAGQSQRGQGVVAKYLNDRGRRILAALDAVADRTGASLASISLAWLMAQPSVAAPIASATSLQQLAELAKAAHLTLSAQDLTELTEASAY